MSPWKTAVYTLAFTTAILVLGVAYNWPYQIVLLMLAAIGGLFAVLHAQGNSPKGAGGALRRLFLPQLLGAAAGSSALVKVGTIMAAHDGTAGLTWTEGCLSVIILCGAVLAGSIVSHLVVTFIGGNRASPD